MLSGKPAELIADIRGASAVGQSDDHVGLHEVAQHLGHVEGVAPGLLVQQMGQLNGHIVRFPPRDGAHQRDHVLRGQAVQRDAGDICVAVQPTQCLDQWPVWAFAVPVSSDEQHPPQVETTQVCHQLEGGPVSPVKIVQDEQHRSGSGKRGEQGRSSAEQQVPLDVGIRLRRGR